MDYSIELTFLKLLKISCAVDSSADEILGITPDNYLALVDLTKRNHLCALIYSAIETIEKSRLLSEAETLVRDALKVDYYRDLYCDLQQRYNLDIIKKELKIAEIPYALVKGTVLKNDYPKPFLRHMSDVDVCIFAEDRNRFRDVMKKIGAVETDKDGNDPNFSLHNTIRIETHGYTFFKRGKYGIQEYENRELSDISSGTLTEEAFALNLIGHMIKHFCRDRLQVYHILDLWIYRHRHTPQPNWEIVMAHLEEDGLQKIAENLIDLGELWLGSKTELLIGKPILCELSDMCIHGSGKSTSEYKALSDIAFAGSKVKAICSNAFLSKVEFVKRYPWLKNCMVLLPIAFLIRIFSTLRRHSTSTQEWLRNVKSVDPNKIKQQREKMKKFGLY